MSLLIAHCSLLTDLRISVIAVNTFLAGALGAVTLAYLSYGMTRKADISLIYNGALAGLVAITDLAHTCYHGPQWL